MENIRKHFAIPENAKKNEYYLYWFFILNEYLLQIFELKYKIFGILIKNMSYEWIFPNAE